MEIGRLLLAGIAVTASIQALKEGELDF